MLKIKNKNIYNDDVKEMLKEYEKTITPLKIEGNFAEVIDAFEKHVMTIDNIINIANDCVDDTTKSRMYLILSIIAAMTYSAITDYVDSINNPKTLIEHLKKALDELLED